MRITSLILGGTLAAAITAADAGTAQTDWHHDDDGGGPITSFEIVPPAVYAAPPAYYAPPSAYYAPPPGAYYAAPPPPLHYATPPVVVASVPALPFGVAVPFGR